VTEPLQKQPDLEPLTRIQVLAAMGVTAVVLLLVSRLWLLFDPSSFLSIQWNTTAPLIGVGLGIGITILSSIVYRLWPAYHASADFYLELVLKPLALPDLVWLGLLPGLSEELLFRGVMLPAVGMNPIGVIASSICFGVMHFSGSQHWSYVIWATAIGLTLGFSAVLTGNLLVPIVAHITTNLISSYVWKLNS
jgi:uncharacterized protein